MELFVVGLFASFVIYAAVALVIILIVIVGVAVIGGMVGLTPKPSRSGAGSSRSQREVELEDGTRIAEEGAVWREVGGYDVYRKNYDGTFSRA